MELKLYNTLTRKKEVFQPIHDNEARIYSCGPTVYDYAHIGNFRTYIFMDILRRALMYEGYKLKHVMNITDVGHLVSDADEGEDKMLVTARAQKKSPWEIAAYYTSEFFKDIEALNISKPEIIPKATDHIKEMIEFVEGLVEKGYGYKTSDGIYFDISKFTGYGKLSGINLDEQMAGARVEVNDEKRHPADFALWKKAPKEHIMQWPSPWGMGYPGWHIECSAMARKYLGDQFDIHTGGVDHIPIHHENEIAQTEALLGKPAVRYWLHGEFLLVDNGKMSKSLGNTYRIADLEAKGFDPLAFRYFCLNAHYRSKLNFTWESMRAAQVAYDRLLGGALAHKQASYVPAPGEMDGKSCRSSDKGGDKNGNCGYSPGTGDIREIVNNFRNEFIEAITDDLNMPKAIGIAWNVVRFEKKCRELYDLLVDFDKILGLDIDKAEEKLKEKEKEREVELEELDSETRNLIEKRQQARKEKNWKLADEIRARLKENGILLEDTPQGVRVIVAKGKDKDEGKDGESIYLQFLKRNI
ncbi:MAG: cysteine--tRNA ligase [Clostridiaceae bacterium]|nr:cysteine--tRNA ligase [Clostridiaceae bacterium]